MDEKPPQRNWARGCAIGCAIVVATALVAGIIVYRVASSKLAQERDKIREEFARTYEEWDHTGAIPEEHRALFDALAASMRHEEATVFSVAAVAATIRCAMDDGAVTKKEIAMLNALKKFLAQKPGLSLIDVGRFSKQFPELKDLPERGRS